MKKKGFTLIELMIVVAIIGILAAIAIPNMMYAKKKASLSACKSNLESIAKALDMYANDNQDKYPVTGSDVAAYDGTGILITEGYMGKGVQCPVGHTDYGYTVDPAGSYSVACMSPTLHYYTPSKTLTALYYLSEGGVKTDPEGH